MHWFSCPVLKPWTQSAQIGLKSISLGCGSQGWKSKSSHDAILKGSKEQLEHSNKVQHVPILAKVKGTWSKLTAYDAHISVKSVKSVISVPWRRVVHLLMYYSSSFAGSASISKCKLLLWDGNDGFYGFNGNINIQNPSLLQFTVVIFLKELCVFPSAWQLMSLFGDPQFEFIWIDYYFKTVIIEFTDFTRYELHLGCNFQTTIVSRL